MNIVIDTSAIIAVILGEPERNSIIEITTGATLIAPESVYWEIGNAFSAMFKKKKADLEKTKIALSIFEKIPIKYIKEIELDKSLEISYQANIYCYDAYLLRRCLKYHAPLITLDKKLIQIAKSISVKVLEV
ncbi:type II toxin-antitoxin system VapC family toxin [Hippea alviniae]|uniref:type II toxin-antitoxin system VapC family toxin n=1 Tax=Hippea alviniae TaxID=1279027 RepID=UPI0003B7606E|nr:type II toxin-antitoxin system VapC family toxin [Hippea alviniae]